MVTISTADSRRLARKPATDRTRSPARRGLAALIVLAFMLVQAAALAHEIQHVLNLHEGPCGLHDAAEHLAMAPAPEPVPVLALAPAPQPLSAVPGARRLPPARPSGARAPPSFS